MDKKDNIIKFNAFRELCLINAETALKSANLLTKQNANHIAYHIIVLALEEIGKIFVGFNEFVREKSLKKEEINFGFDDHIKKLFWAIWGPSIGKEVITKEQWTENQNMASTLHQKRLDSLYTALSDTESASAKIKDEEVATLLSFAEARLNLAKVEGEVDINNEPNPDMDWLMRAMNDPSKRNYILGSESQGKLIELGNPKLWADWLRNYYKKVEKDLGTLAQNEIDREIVSDLEKVTPKWKMKIKIITPSHSIRQKVLDSFNKTEETIKLFKGGDNQTLYIEFIFGNNVSVTTLWQQGWLFSKLYVAALNIGTNGFLYWNSVIDTEKYYESIRDLETDKLLELRLSSGLILNWDARKMVINEQHLHLSGMVFRYFLELREPSLVRAVDMYISGLALLSKSDIHSRFELQIFNLFFTSFKDAIITTLKIDATSDITEKGYQQLEKMIQTKSEYERVISLGYELQKRNGITSKPITLAEVILVKQYCGFYFMTLAARKLHGDDNLSLIVQEGEL